MQVSFVLQFLYPSVTTAILNFSALFIGLELCERRLFIQ